MLQAVTLPVSAITAAQLTTMYQLMSAHYDAVDYSRFAADLVEKDRVIVLHDAAGDILGFTTFKCYPFAHPTTQIPVQIVFSGDTIIDRRHWGTQALAFEWICQAGRQKARHPDHPLFWFLISKGPRTYRYLAAFSHRYWPYHARQTPHETGQLIHALATQRFGADYDPKQGVVRFPASRGHLVPELAEVHATERSRPEVDFFLRANPGYVRGDELVCLTELDAVNLKPLSRRLFEKGMRESITRSHTPCLVSIA